MKAASLWLLVLSCAPWALGAAYTSAFTRPSEQRYPKRSANKVTDHHKDENPSVEQRSPGHVSGKSHTRRPANITASRSARGRFPSGNTSDLHKSDSREFNAAAMNGLTSRQTVNKASPVRRASVIRPTGPSLNNARHRGAGRAAISGSANYASNTSAVNGTTVRRRP
jgi:hypothetical protein